MTSPPPSRERAARGSAFLSRPLASDERSVELVGMGAMPVDSDDAHPAWSCRRKKSYPTQELAHKTAVALTEIGPGVVRDYGCRHCGAWHVGGVPGLRRPPSDDKHRPVRRRSQPREGSYGSARRRLLRQRHDEADQEDDD